MGVTTARQSVEATKLGREILKSNLQDLYRDTNRMFVYLLWGQWILAIILAGYVSPYTWTGRSQSINFHLEVAFVLGGILTIFPVWLIKHRPTATMTRYVVTVAQSFWSALLIHLTGGRIETHFHIFGSLAIISAYRDWRLLIPATLVTVGTHLAGEVFPQSVYGVGKPEWWRFIEHATWVVFEDIFLFVICSRGVREMVALAERQAALESVQEKIQAEVEQKTRELVESSNQKDKLQNELYQSHKLESVGRLAAGIAHEINTPIQYVTDSVYFATEGTDEFFDLLKRIGTTEGLDISETDRVVVSEWLQTTVGKTDYDYLSENLPGALKRSTEGLNRVAEIVRSMKSFAHPDQSEMVPSDLNEAIRTTLIVCRNEYKYLAEIEENLGELPLVTCHLGEINQVLTNLIINASHAISARYIDPSMMGTISIRTSHSGENIMIEIADTGCGIPEENLSRIFEPFFTTKGVGRGTGQGLGIVHGVIVAKLKGTIAVDSKVNEGTKFTLTIPVQRETEQEAA